MGVKGVWPNLVLVHWKTRNAQSQGSEECANGNVKDMVVAWLADDWQHTGPVGWHQVCAIRL